MSGVAAAPLLFDDSDVASPELALVDAGLAAQLRAKLTSGEAFCPRQVARPAYVALVFDSCTPHIEDEGAADLEPPQVAEPSPLEDEAVDVLPAYVVLADEKTVDPALEDEARGVSESFDQLAAQEEVVEELPDYIVRGGESPASASAVDMSTEDAQATSDYPVLPDLDERSDALDETEAALRRIREHMVVPAVKSAPRVRRRFTVVSGIGIAAALAAVAVEVQLGVLHAPGWLGF